MRIIQVSCDSISCLNVIELADDDDFGTTEMLGEFSWVSTVDGDFCSECAVEYVEEETY